jgi:hypothetical protein
MNENNQKKKKKQITLSVEGNSPCKMERIFKPLRLKACKTFTTHCGPKKDWEGHYLLIVENKHKSMIAFHIS